MKKIAFFGNGCTGKTTSMMNLMCKMKLWKFKVGYVSDLSRSITFPPDKFDTDVNARLHILYKQIASECEQTVRPDCDYVLTERTSLDWWIYYDWTCENIGKEKDSAHFTAASSWAKSYDLIYFMEDSTIDYISDGFRPESTKLRDEVSSKYNQVYKYLVKQGHNVVKISNPDVSKRVEEVENKTWLWLGENHD